MTSDVARARPDTPDLTRGYLHQVDVVRLLTFGTVIAVHVVAATTPQQSVPGRGSLMLLHFTRETFFVITGFVLFHSAWSRHRAGTFAVRPFWRKRFLLIGVPYVTWSLVYWLWGTRGTGVSPLDPGRLGDLAFELVTGTAQYHLYFLLVSMQVYLVFPWLLRLVRGTEGHHLALLAGAAVFQLVLFWYLHDAPGAWRSGPGWVTGPLRYAQQLLPSYLFYVVAGALAAVHLVRVQAWVQEHARAVLVALVAGAAGTEAVYLAQVAAGAAPTHASEVLQPVMVLWTVVVTAAMLVAGLAFARRRRPGRTSALVAEAARMSFGIFLVHPLVITLLLASPAGRLVGAAGQPLAAVLLWTMTAVVSFALAELLGRTPLSLALTGRRRPRRGTQRRPDGAQPTGAREERSSA